MRLAYYCSIVERSTPLPHLSGWGTIILAHHSTLNTFSTSATRWVRPSSFITCVTFTARHHASQQVAEGVVSVRFCLARHTYIQAVGLRPTLLLSPLLD